MKRTITATLLLFLSLTAFPQKHEVASEKNDFKYPVLVKLIRGEGNVFRLGFVRKNDYLGVEEDKNDARNIYANFIDLADVVTGNFKNKFFVYFPLSKDSGEMLIVDKTDVTKVDMTYEQSMQLILPPK